MAGQDDPQLRRTLAVQRGARRVLPPGREDDGGGTPADGSLERVREHSSSVHRNGLQVEPLGAQQVVERRVAGVLDGDSVARAEVRLQHPLDPVHRTADDADLTGRDAVARQLPAGQIDQAGQLRGFAVETAPNVGSPERPGQVGQHPAVRIAAGEVSRPVGNRHRGLRRSDRRARSDAGSAAWLCDNHAATAQLGQAGRNRRRADPRVSGQATHRGKSLAGLQCPLGDGGFELADQPGRAASLDPILF